MDFLLSLLYFGLFAFVILKASFFKNICGLPSALMLVFFGIKVLAGFAMIWIYTYVYDPGVADFYKYFRDGMVMRSAFFESPIDFLRMVTGLGSDAEHLSSYYDKMGTWLRAWESPVYNDNRVVIRFNALAGLISGGSLAVHSIIVNFLSFSGLVALLKFFDRYTLAHKKFWLPWGVFLFPSLLFWGSGILKEGLLIWAFGFWVYYTDLIVVERGKRIWKQLWALIFFSFLLFLLKPYTFAFWLPCAIGFYMAKHLNFSKQQWAYATVFAVFVIAAMILPEFFPKYNIVEIIVRKQNDFVNHVQEADAGSIMHTRYLYPGFFSFIKEFVFGLGYALFRPHPLEVYSPLILVAVLENLFIWFLVVYAVIFSDKKIWKTLPTVSLCLWFVIILMGFVGMITPVHGALVRYKIPALPFLWVLWVQVSKLPASDKFISHKLFTSRFFS